MRRFYFDEEGESEEEPNEMDFLPETEFFTMGSMDSPEHHLLGLAIRFCEKSLLWRFFGIDKKLQVIEKTYNSLKKLTEGQEDAEV